MLSRLSISNYALIRSLDIEFPDGLIIITGETGAGKSILMGALSLLTGKRADVSVFHDSAKNCVVEAEFSDHTIIRRVVTPAGRSRGFVNDEPVSMADLSSLSSRLIDIHAQHQHLLLEDPDYRLAVLDCFAGNGSLLERYKTLYDKCEELRTSLSSLRRQIDKAESEAEYREFRYRRLEEASLRDGELSELEAEHKILSNAERLISDINQFHALLTPSEASILRNLKEASALLARCGADIPGMESLSERLDSVRIELDDIEREVGTLSSDIEVSPKRLEEVEERISLLYSLMRKHEVNSERELIALRDQLGCDISRSGEQETELAQMESELERLSEQRDALASELSERRKESAEAFSEEIERSVRSLEMPHASFEVKLSPRQTLSSTGGDDVIFFFGANGEETLSDISKVASGGELSRVMLSLKALMAKFRQMPTMVFDEIDTGVSGRIADRMGDMIGSMGEDMQIFAITHLPQIASKRGAHYLVYKEFGGDGAQTFIRRIEGTERVEEVARMLSGAQLTDAALCNARELLNNG